MKADRRSRAHDGGDEQGIAMVVGAVLVVGLLLATLVTVRVYYVPVWETDAEAAESQVLERQLTELRATLDHQLENRSGAPVDSPLSLGRERSSVFTASAGSGLASGVGFAAGGLKVNVSSNRILLNIVNESAAGSAGLDEDWVTIQGGQEVGNISKVHSFRLRIDQVSKDLVGKSITVNVTDAFGARVGNISVYIKDDPPDYHVFIRTCVDTCNGNKKVFDQGEAYHQTNPLYDFHVDLLDPTYRFDKVMASAARPFKVNLTGNGLAGQYAITFTPLGSGSSSGTSGGGSRGPVFVVLENHTAEWRAGSLTLSKPNVYFPSQDFILEHGALFVRQGDGVAMKLGPPIEASVENGITRLSIGIPTLTGPNASASQDTVTTITTTPGARNDLVGQAPRFTLNLTTSFPALWREFLDTRLADAGLRPGSEYVVRQVGTDTVSMTVYGLIQDPKSLDFDILLTFRQADILVKV